MTTHIYIYNLFNFILFWILPNVLFSQVEEKEIEVINSDQLIIESNAEHTIRKLIGNVELKHDSTTLLCDSAYLYIDKKIVEAMSNVRVFTPNSVKMTCDKLIYDGNSKILELFNRIVLLQKNAQLTTNRLTYYRNHNYGRYVNGGRLSQPDNELVSQIGIYFSDLDSAIFYTKVIQNTSDYTLFADTLFYHTEKKIATFHSPTRIHSKNSSKKIYTERGYYNSPNKVTLLYQNPSYSDSNYSLHADTIFYNDSIKQGRAHCNVIMKTQDNQYFSSGEQLYFDQKNKTTLLTENPYIIQYSKQDTLVIFADTLFAIDDSLNYNRKLKAYRNVRITMKDIQAIADSMSYDRVDSLLKLYKNPIIWSGENQLSGDTILIWLRNNKIDSLKVLNKAFTISKEDSIFYNQIKGKKILTTFNSKNEISYIFVEGNSESVYLIKDGDKYIGVNQSNSKNLEIFLEENRPTQVRFIQNPQAVFHPLHEVWHQPIRLDGFIWLIELKPFKYY